eukprot:4426216-Lingulodinium_polyedra.AAC.1
MCIRDSFSEDSAVLTNGEVDISIMQQFEKCHLDQLIVRDKDGILKGEVHTIPAIWGVEAPQAIV